MGEKLRDAQYITISKYSETNKGDFYFIDFTYHIGQVAVDNIIETIKFNDESREKPFYYAGNSWNGETFDTLCQSKGEDDFKRLGVLRMDVDNMGDKFQSLNKFEDFQCLSHRLDKFFGKTLDDIKKPKHEESIFIIYSGGDDVFAIGDWLHIMEFAKEVHDEFTKEFEGFTISAGVSLITLKYPIMKGAEYAGEEEFKAKCHKYFSGQFEKNSISFMNYPMNWDEEYKPIRKLKKTLCELDKLPSSFLQKILQLWDIADTEAQNNNEKRISKTHKIGDDKLRLYWLIAYDLGRFKERTQDSNIKELIDRCITECCVHNLVNRKFNGEPINSIYHPLELWAIACRWAELELRTNKKTD